MKKIIIVYILVLSLFVIIFASFCIYKEIQKKNIIILKELTELDANILKTAKELEIPFMIAMQLCFYESSFNEECINKNKDKSTDYGLYQLNDRYFGIVTENRANIKVALEHLRSLYKYYNSWALALMKYNRGNRIIREGDYLYVKKILEE